MEAVGHPIRGALTDDVLSRYGELLRLCALHSFFLVAGTKTAEGGNFLASEMHSTVRPAQTVLSARKPSTMPSDAVSTTALGFSLN